MGDGDCGSLSGYSGSVAVASAPVIRAHTGNADGYYFLCVITGDTPVLDASWQQPAHASIRFKRLDIQPSAMPENTTGAGGPSGFGLMLSKMGPAAATDCSDPRCYGIQMWPPRLISPNEFPTRVCWAGGQEI